MSSTDVRRVTELRRIASDRLEVLVGVDDLIVEGVAAGASGWVAGLVNAFPEESVALFEFARDGRADEARQLSSGSCRFSGSTRCQSSSS